MAALASNFIVHPFDSKCAEIVILPNINGPTIGGVTTLTVTPLIASVNIHMTRLTLLRYPAILIVHVTFSTLRIFVLTFEWIGCLFRMVKTLHWCPLSGCMTRFAGPIKLTFVEVVMAIRAVRFNRSIMSILMTRLTGHQFVPS